MPLPSHATVQASMFAPDDWRMLIRLPAEVMVATINVQDHGPRRTVAEGLAGLDAIAAGRGSSSALVRAVVAAIYAEPGDQMTEPAGASASGRLEQVLTRCQRAARLVRASADPGDAEAYLAWLQEVAVRVCGAARSGGVLGLGGEPIAPAEQAFLDDLATALS